MQHHIFSSSKHFQYYSSRSKGAPQFRSCSQQFRRQRTHELGLSSQEVRVQMNSRVTLKMTSAESKQISKTKQLLHPLRRNRRMMPSHRQSLISLSLRSLRPSWRRLRKRQRQMKTKMMRSKKRLKSSTHQSRRTSTTRISCSRSFRC